MLWLQPADGSAGSMAYPLFQCVTTLVSEIMAVSQNVLSWLLEAVQCHKGCFVTPVEFRKRVDSRVPAEI
jgi:hypothetical protein